jgi:hypothetical protein
MSSKVDKKKQREKEVKKKLLARRTAIRSDAKKEREKEKEKRELQRATNKIEGRTICYRRKEEVVNQLEHNLSILEALEAEKKILEQRQQEAPFMNTSGIPLVQEEVKSEHNGIGGTADVVFIPKLESNEETSE